MARSGQAQQVRNSLNANPLDYAGTVVDFSSVGPLALAAHLADELADPALARQVLELVEPVLHRDAEFSVAPPVLLSRAAAAAARVCGDYRRAAELLDRAEEVAASAGAGPEAALVAFERASLLAATRAPAKDVEAAIARAGEALWALDMVGEASRLLELAERCRVNARAAGAGALRGDVSGVELEVIEGLARGLTPDQIADGLLISEKSLQSHLSRLRRRLGVTDVGSARKYLATEPARPAARTDPELRELTAREREVLALIARGLTNQQIADELVISLHTAIRHVANILGKTGAANRTEAARLASRLAHH
jgi:DNA-binding NarL/FixJ family response regulator